MLYLISALKIPKYFILLPVITSCIIPIAITDLWIEIYHRICFPLCKIPYIKRKDYIKLDRHKLKYLNILQKIFCVYCGYANGVIQYWERMAGETEHYWCGIQHKKSPSFHPPKYHKDFSKYGDKQDFNKKYRKIPRKFL